MNAFRDLAAEGPPDQSGRPSAEHDASFRRYDVRARS